MKGSRKSAHQALLAKSRLAELESRLGELRDRQRVHDLVLGVRRATPLLDAVLDAFLQRPSRHLPPAVHVALRMGVYELLYRRSVPQAAIVSETVELLPTRRMKGLGNAVLRRVAESFESRKADQEVDPRRCLWLGPDQELVFDRDILPDPEDDLVAHRAALYGQTPWFVTRVQELSSDPEALLRSFNRRLPLALRPAGPLLGDPEALARKLEAEGVEVKGVVGPIVEVVPPEGTKNWGPLESEHAVAQDFVPALVAPLLDPRPGQRILDLCAAPGGKSVHLAELLRGEGEVVACDVDRKRLRLVKETARRIGVADRIVLHELGDDGKRLPDGPFDRVLVDAPCGNSGVLMKRIEARFRQKPKILNGLRELQLAILRRGAALLRPEGRLVYSSCSILPEENEELLAAFLEASPDFVLEESHGWLPTETGRDGGFAAVLVRSPS